MHGPLDDFGMVGKLLAGQRLAASQNGDGEHGAETRETGPEELEHSLLVLALCSASRRAES